MANDHMHLHDSYEIEIKGNTIRVDAGIIDLVLWMNQLTGVDTFTSCQGGTDVCGAEAFVGFTSADPQMPEKIQKKLGCGQLSQHDDRYQLLFSVSELVALNQKHFPESLNWKNAFAEVLDACQQDAAPTAPPDAAWDISPPSS